MNNNHIIDFPICNYNFSNPKSKIFFDAKENGVFILTKNFQSKFHSICKNNRYMSKSFKKNMNKVLDKMTPVAENSSTPHEVQYFVPFLVSFIVIDKRDNTIIDIKSKGKEHSKLFNIAREVLKDKLLSKTENNVKFEEIKDFLLFKGFKQIISRQRICFVNKLMNIKINISEKGDVYFYGYVSKRPVFNDKFVDVQSFTELFNKLEQSNEDYINRPVQEIKEEQIPMRRSSAFISELLRFDESNQLIPKLNEELLNKGYKMNFKKTSIQYQKDDLMITVGFDHQPQYVRIQPRFFKKPTLKKQKFVNSLDSLDDVLEFVHSLFD